MYHPGVSNASEFDYVAANFQNNLIVDMTSSPSDDSDSKNVSEDSIGKRDFKNPRPRGYIFFPCSTKPSMKFLIVYVN